MVKADVLRNIYLFKEMTNEELAKIIKICNPKEVMAGQGVFFAGQKADSFFVVQQGTINISRTSQTGDDMQVAVLGTDSHFGEMPLLTGETRLANANAAETCHLIEIPFAALRALLTEEVKISDKFHRAIAYYLAKRLQSTTNDLAKAKELSLRD